jgi:hypothetical protein
MAIRLTSNKVPYSGKHLCATKRSPGWHTEGIFRSACSSICFLCLQGACRKRVVYRSERMWSLCWNLCLSIRDRRRARPTYWRGAKDVGRTSTNLQPSIVQDGFVPFVVPPTTTLTVPTRATWAPRGETHWPSCITRSSI